ncbi:MAG: nucleotidyltransferase family protein [Oscillospiraceae bacterium]|nr:nucleotidyltransferase family protein [Oscillospiraceae bacterium]
MITAAIAAEYNPFHSGHARHIAETRQAGATHIVAVMSGNFTQRGTAAVAEKRVRTEAALLGGVDLVVELPLPYAMATAQKFAAGAVMTAVGMGCIDLMSFGSESGYLSILKAASEAVDSPAVSERMSEHLKTGMTFAKARQTAVSELYGDEVADMLASPNDSLAVEYLRALREQKSKIVPFAVQRKGALHDMPVPVGESASASYLRAAVRAGKLDEIKRLCPGECAAALIKGFEEGFGPFDEEKIENVMLGVLRRMTAQELSALPDLSEGLEHRIHAAIRQATTLDEVYALAKSKRYTAARIRRVVSAAFLGVHADLGERPVPYVRVLGFNKRGREILARMKETARLPVSDSLAYLRNLGGDCELFAEAESRATDLYLLGMPVVRPCGLDYTKQSVRML